MQPHHLSVGSNVVRIAEALAAPAIMDSRPVVRMRRAGVRPALAKCYPKGENGIGDFLRDREVAEPAEVWFRSTAAVRARRLPLLASIFVIHDRRNCIHSAPPHVLQIPTQLAEAPLSIT